MEPEPVCPQDAVKWTAITLERIEEYVTAGDYVGALLAMLTLRANVEALEVSLVCELRHDEATWTYIGSILGVSRQAAHERFSPHLRH